MSSDDSFHERSVTERPAQQHDVMNLTDGGGDVTRPYVLRSPRARLRKLMRDHGLRTAVELAKAFGVSVATASRWLSGETTPRATALEAPLRELCRSSGASWDPAAMAAWLAGADAGSGEHLLPHSARIRTLRSLCGSRSKNAFARAMGVVPPQADQWERLGSVPRLDTFRRCVDNLVASGQTWITDPQALTVWVVAGGDEPACVRERAAALAGEGHAAKGLLRRQLDTPVAAPAPVLRIGAADEDPAAPVNRALTKLMDVVSGVTTTKEPKILRLSSVVLDACADLEDCLAILRHSKRAGDAATGTTNGSKNGSSIPWNRATSAATTSATSAHDVHPSFTQRRAS